MLTLLAISAAAVASPAAAGAVRWHSRRRRRYARLLIEPYRGDRAGEGEVAGMLRVLHSLLYVRGLRRLLWGQPSFALEVHLTAIDGRPPLAWLAVCCPADLERQVQAALRASYPNCGVRRVRTLVGQPPAIIRLRRHAPLARSVVPVRSSEPRAEGADPERPLVDRVLGAMAAGGGSALVQIALAPAPRWLEHFESPHEQRSPADARPRRIPCGPLLFGDVRIVGSDLRRCRAIAAEVRGASGVAPWRLVERSGRIAGPSALRLARGELEAIPALARGVYTPAEIACLWGLPSVGFTALPLVRRTLPVAPAPPRITRCCASRGLLRDEHGLVTLGISVRRQNTAVVGTVEQGKSSYLVASVREDLRREDCAVVVLDPKGDAADAAISAVPLGRVCTVLDMARPSCGFNPLLSSAAPDAVADYVVASLRGLFSEGEVKGSSDRYLRNALIAAIACELEPTLWHVAALLGAGADARLARERAGQRLVELPEHAQVASFLLDELPAQLRDARAATTAKLDAPANKLARVINSAAVARVLRNDSLRIDFDSLIRGREVLIVRGALGEIGPGNVAVLMQLLLGMLDAALGRVQDRAEPGARTAVALKIDEAPLVINEAFAQTLALKRSAGLETVACWQTDAQWPAELREQLDALFAHRVLFATASAQDARAGASLLMTEYTDQLRGGDAALAQLAAPDVRLHLPRHRAIVSWTTSTGRERPFLASTLPMEVDPAALARQRAEQLGRGGREASIAQPAKLSAILPASPETPLAGTADPQSGAAGGQFGPATSQLAATAPETPPSWLELVTINAATSARCQPIPPRAVGWSHDAQEIEMLAWIAAARCALTSQIHRRFNPDRALTTTQRRLKRLADAGLIARVQFVRAVGGRMALCCASTQAGVDALGIRGRMAADPRSRALDELRLDVHVVGWLLALERAAAGALLSVLGPGRPRLAPFGVSSLAELSLGERLRPRDFVDEHGNSVERFGPVAPLAAAEVRLVGGATTDLLLVSEPAATERVLRTYDHLLSGWWRAVPRYARTGAPPRVVVLCPDASSARAAATRADPVLCACLAEIGVPREQWSRPGRAGIAFVDAQSIHAASLACVRTSPVPGGEPVAGRLLQLASAGEPTDTPAVWH
ncbi:MAG: replication-relaxation family protein [Solirubrobacteraceae bacterium]